ncbi:MULTISPECIES: L,D-transpeptidase family protein [Sphingomonas]|nr:MULTISPECIES: L,D-transpeptidase family protein [Sphingomonas]
MAEALRLHPALAPAYAEAGYRPLWTSGGQPTPASRTLIGLLAERDRAIPNSAHYDLPRLQALAAASPAQAGLFDVALSQALAAFVADTAQPSPGHRLYYVDAELAPPTSPAAVLHAARQAPSPERYLAGLQARHPFYTRLDQAVAASGAASTPGLRASLDAARALPGDGRRHIVVNIASAELWMFDAGGRIADHMRVIVGKPGMATPPMAGLIRYAVRTPYWNLPPDLARERARKIVAGDADLLTRERIELLSAAGADTRPIDPASVDWQAVAAGARTIRMRQLPGPDNMMGQIKFMLPNRLGIYLHDTPMKAAFAHADRRASSGCVRLEDAERLAHWLFDGHPPAGNGTAEQRFDLPRPVPVYIVNLPALSAG